MGPVRQRFEISEEYGDCLAAAGLSSFDDLCRGSPGNLLTSQRRKDVRYLELRHRGRTTGFYLKQVSTPRRTLRQLVRGGIAPLPTTREARMLRTLAGKGIPAAKVAAWGDRRLFGRVPLRGFLLVEEVCGEEVVELFETGDPALRKRLLRALARLAARLAGIGFHHSPRLKDLICTSPSGEEDLELALIDQDVGPELDPQDEREACAFLARAYAKMRRLGQGLSVREIRLFLTEFASAHASGRRPRRSATLREIRAAAVRFGRARKRYAAVLTRDEKHARS